MVFLAAQEAAAEVCGDVNLDGTASWDDLELLREHLATSGGTLTPEQLARCSVTGESDDCTIADVAVLTRFLESPFLGPALEPLCGAMTAPAVCGDGFCAASEDFLVCAGDCPIDCRDPNTWPELWAELETEMLGYVNLERSSPTTCRGVVYPAAYPVSASPEAREAARCHSLDMAFGGVGHEWIGATPSPFVEVALADLLSKGPEEEYSRGTGAVIKEDVGPETVL